MYQAKVGLKSNSIHKFNVEPNTKFLRNLFSYYKDKSCGQTTWITA
jgi:hypothetical protein